MPPPITLSNVYIINVKSDVLKGHVGFTLRSRLSLELMKLRNAFVIMEDKPLEVVITSEPDLFSQIETKSFEIPT